MPTPTDPYSSSSNRPPEGDILAPIPPGAAADAQGQQAADTAGTAPIGAKPAPAATARPDATLADGSGYAAQAPAPSPSETAQSAVAHEPGMDNATAPLGKALDVSPLTAVPDSNIANLFEDAAQPAAESWDPVPSPIDAIPERPKSRIGAHIGIFFATILLIPVAWYLLSDSSIRLAFLDGSQWETGRVAIPVLLETIGALAVTGLVWFLARASSLGAFVWGLALTVVGAIGVVTPYFARNTIVSWVADHIADMNTLTGNIAHHFSYDLGSGRILFFGFLLFMTSIVSHYARKRGNLAGIQTTRRAVALDR